MGVRSGRLAEKEWSETKTRNAAKRDRGLAVFIPFNDIWGSAAKLILRDRDCLFK
jgi:hypothetical protein